MPTFLFFDTETTGLPSRRSHGQVDQPRIVSIAWATWNSKSLDFDDEYFLVQPDGFEIPPAATRVHGISTEEASTNGSPLNHVLRSLCTAVDKANPDMVVAHNTDFDVPVLQAEFDRLKLRNPLRDKKVICTMKSTIDFCDLPSHRDTPKWPKLSELYLKIAGNQPAKKHNALSDVHTLMSCFMALCEIGFYEVEGLHASDFRLKKRLIDEQESMLPRYGRVKLMLLAGVILVHVFGAVCFWIYFRN